MKIASKEGRMKKAFLIAVSVALFVAAMCPVPAVGAGIQAPAYSISGLSLEGEIDGENIMFDLAFRADINERNVALPLVIGDVAYLEGRIPKNAELTREKDKYLLKFKRGGKEAVSFSFASRAIKEGDWRRTSFYIPVANIRKLSVICDRDDLEVRFPGALDVQRKKTKEGRTQVTAFLGVAGMFEVRWKPEVRKLEAELVVTSDANTIATASVGALRLDTVFTYRIIQGALSKLVLELPDVNVTQVRGEDIQDWRIDRTDKNSPKLVVALSRPKEDLYRLRVESEMILPKFPCEFDLPVLGPEDVIRASGFLMIGTDSAIKLQVEKAGGLTQVDQASFPAMPFIVGDSKEIRAKPSRSTYAYQYASTPYTLALEADDIVTSFSADNRLVLSLEDSELVFEASIEIDVKDAPAREILIETDPDAEWTVTSVTGKHVSEADTDVREENGKRVIYVPFKQAVSGVALITVRMEKTLPADAATFAAPRFVVLEAKSERGYLVLAAEKGVRLKSVDASGLREVHTGSAPMRVAGAQQAFRFKEAGWAIAMEIERTIPSLHAEVFHLVSLGEGVMYCSAAITYHIGGAPLQEFKVRVPAEIETVEFTGADIEGWTRDGEICDVRLQTKIMGDYTLLVTYDKQFDHAGSDIAAGGIQTVSTETEVGYIAAASSANLKLTEAGPLPASIIEIDRDEIPTAYSSPVTDPIIRSYKYVRTPHTAMIRVEPLDTEQLLGQIADYVKLETTLTKDGEAVTVATYYIKNASYQYLVVSLPKAVDLWSIKYVDEEGRKQDVLSQKSDKGILIPVQRPRDPNTAIVLELVFAQSHGKLGFWRSGIAGTTLVAPTLPDTHATFADWKVDVPEKFALAGVGGNMTTSRKAAIGGLPSVVFQAARLWLAVLDGFGGLTLREALTPDWGGVRSETFTRTVNLSGENPLSLSLQIVPSWMGSASSARVMTGTALVGLLLTIGSCLKKKAVALTALGLTVLAFGIAQGAAGRSVLAVLLAVAVAVVAWRLLVKKGFKAIWKCVCGLARWLWTACAWLIGLLGRGLAGLAKLCAGGWKAFRESRERAHLRKLELRMASKQSYEPPPFEAEKKEPVEPEVIEPERTDEGHVSPRMLCLMLAATLMAGCALAKPAAKGNVEPPSRIPVMDSIEISIEGPGTGREAEQSAGVVTVLRFEAEERAMIPVAPGTAVLTEYDLNSRYLRITSRKEGYILEVTRKGTYQVTLKYRIPVVEQKGRWRAEVPMLENMRNRVKLALPEPGLDIESDAAVLFKTGETDKSSSAEAVFGPVKSAGFTWRPRIRKVTLEEVVFFCEVNTYALLQSGLVDLTSLIRYQVAQGEIKELKVRIPENMSVTAVNAPGLATWSFDPEKRLLDAILEKPVSGDFTLAVITQLACEGLPYSAVLGVPGVPDASRQRGSIAVAAPDTVQVRIEDVEGLNPMNIEDFSSAAASGTGKPRPGQAIVSIRRAFRYHRAEEASVKIHTERVLPEIRVVEGGTLSIGDERIVLATKLELLVAKSGIFSVELGIPEDFDVETLTGKDVSHWDEVKNEDGRGVVVHFSRRVPDSTEIDLVVARTEKGIEEKIVVPRVTIADARKHKGRLTVSGERGVRMMVESHRGVDIKKASEEGISQAGVFVFDILRPNWAIVLKTEVMAALVKPEVLQWVDLTEGMLQCRAYIRYKIENAGVKTFLLKSPVPGVTLSVTGRNVSRVHEVDKEAGLWQVDLHNKVENVFSVTVTYQVPYAPEERKVSILPLQAVDTDPQRGYLVVTCGGRVQVEPAGDMGGLKVEDPRNIPAVFGAGDLSNAILCYRTVRKGYELALSVVRHGSADVLPANIEKVSMTSVVSPSGRLLTRIVAQMTVGDLRFLKLSLPNKNDTLWTVLVDGREVATSRDGELYCIPLEEQEGGGSSTVDLVCAGSSRTGGFLREQRFKAPKFEGLPLDDIEWNFYVQPDLRYYGFGGTMEYREPASLVSRIFSSEQYSKWNKEQRKATLAKARQVLDDGEELMKAGKQRKAKKAFQQALNYSQGQADLNEDARVQLRNLVKQQVKLGLVNRRDALRVSRNIQAEQQEPQQTLQGFQDGDYSQEYASSVEQRLTQKDNTALEIVADKIIDQQAAAAGVVSAISVTMPEHGRELNFYRRLQIDPEGDLTVTFRAGNGWLAKALMAAWPCAVLFVLVWAGLARRRAVAA